MILIPSLGLSSCVNFVPIDKYCISSIRCPLNYLLISVYGTQQRYKLVKSCTRAGKSSENVNRNQVKINSPKDELERSDSESPQHSVTVPTLVVLA